MWDIAEIGFSLVPSYIGLKTASSGLIYRDLGIHESQFHWPPTLQKGLSKGRANDWPPNNSFQRTTPAPHSVLPLAIGIECLGERKSFMGYHGSVRAAAARGKPSLGSGVAAELERSLSANTIICILYEAEDEVVQHCSTRLHGIGVLLSIYVSSISCFLLCSQ